VHCLAPAGTARPRARRDNAPVHPDDDRATGAAATSEDRARSRSSARSGR